MAESTAVLRSTSRVPAPLVASLIRRLHLDIRRRALTELHAAGHTSLAAAHMYIFQSPGPDGLRPSELAARSNTTKQAMNNLLGGLERHDYLRREPDPTDRRGTVIRLTDRGREVERLMVKVGRAVEDEWAGLVGGDVVNDLRRALQLIETATRKPPT